MTRSFATSLAITLGFLIAGLPTPADAGDGNPFISTPSSSNQPTVIDSGVVAPTLGTSSLPTVPPVVPLEQIQQPAVAVEQPAVAAPSQNQSWDSKR